MLGRRNVVECIVGLGLLTPARYTVHEGGSTRGGRSGCSSKRGPRVLFSLLLHVLL